MKLHAHFLADSANFASDGTFTVFRGGINEVNSPAWPILLKVASITRLEFTPEEATKLNEYTQQITFEGQGRSHVMAQVRQPIALKVLPGKPIYANLIGNLNLIVPGSGRITIQTLINDEALPLLHFEANQAPLPT